MRTGRRELVFPFKIQYKKANSAKMHFHSHREHELFYLHEGEVKYSVNGKVFLLYPGDMMLMHRMAMHCAFYNDSNVYVRTIVNFEPEFLYHSLDPSMENKVAQLFESAQNRIIRFVGSSQTEAEQLLHDIQQTGNKQDDISLLRLRHKFIDFMLLAYSQIGTREQDGNETLKVKERNVLETIQFIDEQFRNDLSLDKLEKQLHLNKHYLSRIFKEVTGMTIWDYISERRLNQAKYLLLEGRLKLVGDVGYEVGFKQTSHFCKLFKEHTGCSPGQYAALVQQQSRRWDEKSTKDNGYTD